MRKWLLPGAVLLALALFGCDNQKLMNLFVPERETKAGQAFIEDVRTGNFAPVLAAVDPTYAPQLNVDLLKRLQALFGGQAVKIVKVVGSRFNQTLEFKRYGVTFEYELTKQWLLAEIVMQPEKGHLQIEGLHAQQMRQSLEQIHAFTLAGRGAKFLIFLAAAVLVPIFIIGTAIVCWRTTIPRGKWWWRILVLMGITNFSLNWTTGEIGFQPVAFNILGAGFKQELYGPMILQVGMPVAAILFWIWRRKWSPRPEESAGHFG